MPIVVQALPEAEFEAWVTEQKQAAGAAAEAAQAALSQTLSKEELMTQGEQVYLGHCAACHQPNGEGLQGVFPHLKGSPIATGPLSGHLEIVLNGKTGTAMQAFSKQLTAQEIAAVTTYERNAWGNNTGDAVQAKDVNEYMNGNSAQTSAAVPSSTTPTPAPATDVSAAVDPASLPTLSHDALMAEGETVYATFCAACHQVTGAGIPPAFPALVGSAIAIGPVANHIDIVMHGKTGTAMQAFGKQLSPQQLAAVITYERNAWGNNTGDTVQPADIASHGQ